MLLIMYYSNIELRIFLLYIFEYVDRYNKISFIFIGHVWAPVTIAMIGKFLISMTFAIAYLYTAELFPTSVRNVAVGAASTFARIGSMSAPYIVDLLVSNVFALNTYE